MTQQRRALGAFGEELAARYLARKGYRILARNIRAGGVELDLVAARGRICAFVEVKTRRTRSHGPPESAVDARKQARLARGAIAWLREQGAPHARRRRARFDVIAVEIGAGGGWQLRHWPGAFDQPGGAGA